MQYCPDCGTQLQDQNQKFCFKCGINLQSFRNLPHSSSSHANELTDQQRRQIQLETIWMHEKTVPKMLRGTLQAKLSFNALEKGLTEGEKQYLKRRRDTE